MRFHTQATIQSKQQQGRARIGQRRTAQRNAILRVIDEAAGPLSISEIHRRAKGIQDKIGIATIYRTLNLLEQKGLVEPVDLPSGALRFESANNDHHEHFQCRMCHELFTLSVCPFTLPVNSILDGGFIVEDHKLLVYGVCPSCTQRKVIRRS